MYTKIEFGKELERRVLEKQTILEISKWAKSIYPNKVEDADFNFLELLLTLSALTGDFENELDYEDLLEIAEILQADEEVEL